MAIVQEKPPLPGVKTCRAFLIDSSFVQNSSTDTELLIANEEMFRLQYALRQALAAYGDDQTEVGFALADCQIAVFQGEIHVYRDRALCGAVSLAVWQKRPRQALEQLYGYIFPKETDKA